MLYIIKVTTALIMEVAMAIVAFVGLKMLLHEFIHVPEWASLAFITVSLLLGILVSLKFGHEKELTDSDLS